MFLDVRDHIGGDSVVLLNTLRKISREKFDIFVACLSRGELYRELKKIDGITLKPLDFGTRDKQIKRTGLAGKFLGALSLIRTLVATLRLALLARLKQIELLHTNNTQRAALVSLLLKKLIGLPFIYHGHCKFLGGWIHYRSAMEAEKVLAVSHFTKSTYIAAGIPEEKIEVLYNGIDESRFNPELAVSGLRQELGVPSDVPLIGLVGRLTPGKGQEDLLRAAPKVLAQVDCARFVLVGDDMIYDRNESYQSRLKRIARELGVERSIIFTGFRLNTIEVYSALDIVLVPSWQEDFGMVVIEGMAMGKPVIATNAGGIPEIINNGSGLLVPPKDPDSLAEAIVRLLKDNGLRQELGDKGRRRVEEAFTLDSYIRRVEEILLLCSLSRASSSS